LAWLVERLKVLGAVCLAWMMLVTCVDVVFRYFGRPILGAVEVVGFLSTMAVAFALPYTHKEEGHIGVEFLFRILSPRTQAVLKLVVDLISIVLFALVTWQMFGYALTMQKSGQVSMNLKFPEYLIIYVVSICFLTLTILILRDVFVQLRQLKGKP